MISNRTAFLDAVAACEGTSSLGTQNGYNVLVGSTPAHPLFFSSYADHPRVFNKALDSTAAGRYQLLAHWFDAYRKLLKLPDFSPASQDIIALQQIKERRALPDIDTGHFYVAIVKCASIWASLPGSPYGQHTQSLDFVKAHYLASGGIIA